MRFRALLTALAVLMLAAGCASPDIQATVDGAVQKALAERPTPTPSLPTTIFSADEISGMVARGLTKCVWVSLWKQPREVLGAGEIARSSKGFQTRHMGGDEWYVVAFSRETENLNSGYWGDWVMNERTGEIVQFGESRQAIGPYCDETLTLFESLPTS